MSNQKTVTLEVSLENAAKNATRLISERVFFLTLYIYKKKALRSKYKPVTLAKPSSWPFPFSTVQQINKRHVDSSLGKTSYLVKFKEGSTAEVPFFYFIFV
jgi:hypothetical protein